MDLSPLTPEELDKVRRYIKREDKKAKKQAEIDRNVAAIARALGQKLEPPYIKP